ncbi:MAG: dienelactone hydrolase family protein [Porticoccaceae bacterium]
MRRGFITLLLVGIGVLLATRVGAQEAVAFEASQPFSADKLLLKAELFRPNGPGHFPAVVLLHGCGGWQPAVHYSLNTHARYLQQRGFVVLNVDSFGPRHTSGGKLCADDRALYKALSYRTEDAFDALRYLQKLDYVAPDNIFLMGQSNGGAVAIRVAKTATSKAHNNGGAVFRGVVAYYPWCGEFGSSRVSLASPLLIFAGGRDDWVPARECQNVKATGAGLEVTIYPEAAHSFDLDILPQRFLGKLIGSDPLATQDSRAKMLTFFINAMTDGLKRQYAARDLTTTVAQNTSFKR